jgi:acyl-CoA synthetase (AMP-forming)/AMP-acid ligase II
MAPVERAWLEQLARTPDAPFLIAGDDIVTAGMLADAVAKRVADLRRRGWTRGHRMALVPGNDISVPVSVLAALANDISVLLLPRREPDAARRKLAAAVGAGDPDGPPPPHADGPPATVWIRSSGSFGRPRWIIHTDMSLLAGAAAAAGHLDFGPGARWLMSLPVDHVGGLALVFRALAGGGALVAADLETGLARGDVTHLSLVPTQLVRLLDRGADLSSLRCVLVGGAAVPVGLRRRALDAGVPLVVSYGLSETGAAAAATAMGEPAAALCREHYAGRPLLPRGVDVDAGGRRGRSRPVHGHRR